MEIGHAKQRVLLAAVGAALLISDCLYSLARVGAEKANLMTAKLTYASLGAPRWDRNGTTQGMPGKGQAGQIRARCVPQPPQFVRSYPSAHTPPLWGNPGCGDEGPGTGWTCLFLCEVARSHPV